MRAIDFLLALVIYSSTNSWANYSEYYICRAQFSYEPHQSERVNQVGVDLKEIGLLSFISDPKSFPAIVTELIALSREELLALGDLLLKNFSASEVHAFAIFSLNYNHAYEKNRGLLDYAFGLGPQMSRTFLRDVFSLKPSDLWVDSGSGNGMALLEYLSNSPAQLAALLEQALAFPKAERPSDWQYQDQHMVTFLNGLKPNPKAAVKGLTLRYDRDIRVPLKIGYQAKLQKLQTELLSTEPYELFLATVKPTIITDYIGIFSYSSEPLKVLRIYLNALKKGGRIYLKTGNHFISDEKGNDERLNTFLCRLRLRGLKIEMDTSHNANHASLKITKLDDVFELPNDMPLINAAINSPPYGLFQRQK